jgi:UPF0716 protein FxsA
VAAALFLAFVLIPLAEIYVIVQVGHVLGVPLTLAVLLAVSIGGAVLVKREGTRAWAALRAAVAAGRVPGREAVDGALVLAGGALLLTPGFLTDAVGLLLVLPVTRPLARRVLQAAAFRRLFLLRAPSRAGQRSGRARSRIVDRQVLRGRARR